MWLKTSEERSNPLEDPNNSIAQALMMLGGSRTITGRPMNDAAALSLAAVFAAVQVIAGDIATIPLKVYRRLDNGGRDEENGHALWDLLGLSPFPMVTSTAWRDALQGHLLLRGNGYSEIRSNARGVVRQIVPLDPREVTRKGEIYEIGGSPPHRRIHASSMLHFAGAGGNGVDGWSVITLARENLSLSQALEESNLRFIANSAQPSGFLSNPNPLTPEAAKRARQMWDRASGGLDNRGGTPVLDGEWKWQQTSLTAEDAQYVTSRQFSVTDVARWFNIPPHKIRDLERATFSNIAEQSTDYVMGTLRPWVVRHEQEMNTKLLTVRERNAGLFIAYNLDGLLRGDIKTRSESQRTQFEVGGLTTNEIRAMENRNPVEGGDRAMVRLDMVPLQRIDEVQSVETDDEGRISKVVFAEKRARETRTPAARLALRQTFRALFMNAAGRMLRGELRNVRRILSRTALDELRAALEAYYFDDHPPFATNVMGPVFRAYVESVSVTAATEVDSDIEIDTVVWSDNYVDTFANRYSASSRRLLTDLAPDEVEQRLVVWSEGTESSAPRFEQVASRELVRLAESTTRATWVAAGIATFVWRTVGDSCPFCLKLNGRVVGRSTPFMAEGDSLAGNEGDSPLVVKSDINHAPAHQGCDCTIVPGG